MHVKIGPYPTYWGPYQIADLLFGKPQVRWNDGFKQTWRHRAAEWLGDKLAASPVGDFLSWVGNKRKRQEYVRIDGYDVWNMDSTLRLIIGPMFKKLRDCKHGYGYVHDEDAPPHLHSTQAPPPDDDNCWDSLAEARYAWLLDEMIWVFCTDHDAALHGFYDDSEVDHSKPLMDQIEQIKVDDAGRLAYQARIDNAYRLFGKYYQTFWD